MGIKSPCSSSNVLNSSEFKLSLAADCIGSTLNTLSILELRIFVNQTRGLNIVTNIFRTHEDLVAKFSGYTLAIVFGVISEKIKITIVKMIDPSKTLLPKCSIIIIVTIAEAKILAKLLLIKIDASNTSGLCSNLRALMAPLEPLERFLNFTLFDAIIPVSDPDEKAEKISSTNNAKNKKEIESVLKKTL